MEIGEVIKKIIKKRGLSQKDVAKEIGKSPTALSQIINGNYKPQADTLEALSRVLKVPVPVFHFLSISEDIIPKHKLELFRALAPSMESYLINVFDVDVDDLNLKVK